MARPSKYDTGQRILETSGVPRRGDTSPALQELFARKFGILPRASAETFPLPERFTDIPLGNPDLPVHDHRIAITQTVHDNPISIFVAETGAGKSTQIIQYLLQAGYEVIMTQPRRLAAEMLAQRIQDEIQEELGAASLGLIGFQTAEKSTVTDRTRGSVVTDGLQLVRDLNNDEHRDVTTPRVVIVDEVHERNKNIDVLMASLKKKIKEGDTSVRIVYMSASMNADKLSRYHADTGFLPPILEIPGAPHNIERLEEPSSTVVDEAVKYARAGKNILVFLPGVTEINDTISAIEKRLSGSKGKFICLPLHGKMSSLQQHAVEMEVNGVKIVCATNIAETSITIPDVDVVIDSGLERRVEIDNEGIESLKVLPISRAGCTQRSGRCGRTHDGTYVLTRLNDRVHHTPLIKREEYSKPEILRTNLDRTVLSVAGADLNIKRLDLLDPIDHKKIDQSNAALRILGALDDDNKITQRGRRMNKMPLRPSLGRMIVYAEEHNFSEEMKCYVAAMTAAANQGGLPDYTRHAGKEWRKLTDETSSDLLAQLDMYLQTMHIEDPRELAELDLNVRTVERAREQYVKLLRRMHVNPSFELLPTLSEEQRRLLRDCIVAGEVNYVYEANGKEFVRSSHRMGRAAVLRELSDRSVIKGHSDFVVATPYMISPPPGSDMPEKHIIQDVTKTSARQLGEIAGELCSWEDDSDSSFIWRGGKPYTRQVHVFRGTIPTGEFREEPAAWSKELASEIIKMARQKPGKALREINGLKKKSEDLYRRSGTSARILDDEVRKTLEEIVGLNRNRSKIMNVNMLDLELAQRLEEFKEKIPSADEEQSILAASPDFVEFEGLSLQLEYRDGNPQIARITDEIKKTLARLPWEELQLDDGRDILIPHAVKKYKRTYTLASFKQMYDYRAL